MLSLWPFTLGIAHLLVVVQFVCMHAFESFALGIAHLLVVVKPDISLPRLPWPPRWLSLT